MKTIRILIADDHFVVRQGVRRMLQLYPDLEVVGEAADGAEALDGLGRAGADLLMMDMTMPGLGGTALIGRVRERWPALPILVLSMHKDAQVALGALRAGANGYVTKDSEPAVLAEAIRKVAAGGRHVDPALAEQVLFESLAPHTGVQALSQREREVLERIAAGDSINQVAETLHLSAKTVSTHKMRIMQKLDIHSNADLILFAAAEGLVPPRG
ncbi:MAG: response regulator transcription factor [Candidatus Nitricoxidivorans perseverans]|uniref:Response regulator transcription factor n=1 Tax=Candidatus Nitricoxidivorans perseverans TaxID=2975601 RepID=A0AA49FM25_9PROT|nr:MAG: response regulator transcription factor [Candidatus Nitricoxidivorans perseverans]